MANYKSKYTGAQIDSHLDKVDTNEATITALSSQVENKQEKLVSGTNIKTINNQPILGSGNIDIQGGGATEVVDLTPYLTSTASGAITQDVYNKIANDNTLIKVSIPGEGTFYAKKFKTNELNIIYLIIDAIVEYNIIFLKDLSFSVQIRSVGGDYQLSYDEHNNQLGQVGAINSIYAMQINRESVLNNQHSQDLVVPNIAEPSTDILHKVKLGKTIYEISSGSELKIGGAGGSSDSYFKLRSFLSAEQFEKKLVDFLKGNFPMIQSLNDITTTMNQLIANGTYTLEKALSFLISISAPFGGVYNVSYYDDLNTHTSTCVEYSQDDCYFYLNGKVVNMSTFLASLDSFIQNVIGRIRF